MMFGLSMRLQYSEDHLTTPCSSVIQPAVIQILLQGTLLLHNCSMYVRILN